MGTLRSDYNFLLATYVHARAPIVHWRRESHLQQPHYVRLSTTLSALEHKKVHRRQKGVRLNLGHPPPPPQAPRIILLVCVFKGW